MTLSAFIESNNDIRKLFGKKELEIMTKQLQGFLLSQSEKNRLSRDIRKKLEVIKELSRFSEEFELKKNQNNKSMINSAIDEILNQDKSHCIEAILLFGSMADKSHTINSDIDLCLVFKKNLTIREATLFRKNVLANTNKKIDLQVFNLLPKKIKKSIAQNHKILYRRSSFNSGKFFRSYMK